MPPYQCMFACTSEDLLFRGRLSLGHDARFDGGPEADRQLLLGAAAPLVLREVDGGGGDGCVVGGGGGGASCGWHDMTWLTTRDDGGRRRKAVDGARSRTRTCIWTSSAASSAFCLAAAAPSHSFMIAFSSSDSTVVTAERRGTAPAAAVELLQPMSRGVKCPRSLEEEEGAAGGGGGRAGCRTQPLSQALAVNSAQFLSATSRAVAELAPRQETLSAPEFPRLHEHLRARLPPRLSSASTAPKRRSKQPRYDGLLANQCPSPPPRPAVQATRRHRP